MKISIVIPCFNMEKYLAECLDSLYRQDLPLTDFEVIIVNDESEDRTLHVAKNYAVKYHNIKIIDKKNGGVGAARNSGLNLATGTYVYFLDADDLISNDSLAILLKTLEENELDVLTFNNQMFKTSVSQKSLTANHTKKTTVVKVTDGLDYMAQKKYNNEVWWYIINRDFLMQSGYRFIEGHCMEDTILTDQLINTANRIRHVDLSVNWYSTLNTSGIRNKIKAHFNNIIYVKAGLVYQQIVSHITKILKRYNDALTRLKTPQESFVFFLLLRFIKSVSPVSKIPEMIADFKQIDAYPLQNFYGPDYHGINRLTITFIFSKKPLINPVVKVFRTFYTLAK